MLRTVLQVTGLARALGDLRFRLEDRAERAVAQVKGVAVRIAVAAALALAAVIFTLFAMIVGLVILYTYLEPLYGVTTSLAIIGGSLMGIALVCVLAAALTGRAKAKRKDSDDLEADKDLRTERKPPLRRYALSSREARDADAVDSLVSLASIAQRRDRRSREERVSVDALSLLQSGDRRTMFAVIGAVAAVGWLMGRTMPRAAR
jgi:hypothetical protein